MALTPLAARPSSFRQQWILQSMFTEGVIFYLPMLTASSDMLNPHSDYSLAYYDNLLVIPNEATAQSSISADKFSGAPRCTEDRINFKKEIDRPRRHEIFNLKKTRDLFDILANRAGMETRPKVKFFVLQAGTLSPNSQLSDTNTAVADYVLIDFRGYCRNGLEGLRRRITAFPGRSANSIFPTSYNIANEP